MTLFGVPTSDVAMFAVAIGAGIALIKVDIREHRLPNRLTAGAAVALALITVTAAVVQRDGSRVVPMFATGAAMAATGYLLAVLSPEGFGLGDVKLLGVIGLAIGHFSPQLVVLWLLALAVSSAGWLLVASRLDHKSDRSVPWHKRHVAFGPPMIVAWWLVYLVPMLLSPE